MNDANTLRDAHALRVEVQAKRKELGAKLPALAMRIFALQNKPYQGYGFHWGLVKTIGTLLRNVNDYDSKFTLEDMMINEVLYECLVEQVEAAESSVHELQDKS
jgi:hypothetical protein